MAGELEPGIRVRYRDLAEQFGVSVTPVRAALRELAHEGLIDARPNSANYVSPLSLDEIEQLYLARMGFESWLAQLGAPRLSSHDLSVMEERLQRFQAAAERSNTECLMDIAWEMRSVCYEAADRPGLLQKAADLYDRSRRYTHRTLLVDFRRQRSTAVAKAFYGACLGHDGELAAETIRGALRGDLPRSPRHDRPRGKRATGLLDGRLRYRPPGWDPKPGTYSGDLPTSAPIMCSKALTKACWPSDPRPRCCSDR